MTAINKYLDGYPDLTSLYLVSCPILKNSLMCVWILRTTHLLQCLIFTEDSKDIARNQHLLMNLQSLLIFVYQSNQD